MEIRTLEKKHIIFDWGDTLMKDDTCQTEAMYLWPTVEAIVGAESVLRVLSKGSTISVATSAARSDDAMVRNALRRVGINEFVTHIFTGRTIGRKKTDPAFWRHIQNRLGAEIGDILVVGDSFESDVLAPTNAGFTAIWFNPNSEETRDGKKYSTIHKLAELIGVTEPNES